MASAVLTGALLVGDSVRGSLRELTLERLGGIDVALVSDRFFRQELLDDLTAFPEFAATRGEAAPAVILRGAAVHGDSDARASGVSIHGIDERFAKLHGAHPDLDLGRRPGQIFPSVAISRGLARELGAAEGDPIVLSFGRFSPVPRDTLMGDTDVESVLGTLRVTVVEILPENGLGQFGLSPTQQEPLGAFVEIKQLQRALDAAGRINAIFLGSMGEQAAPDDWLTSVVQLQDFGLSVRPREGEFDLESDEFVLRPRVDDAVTQVAAELGVPLLRVQSYLANGMRFKDRLIPYSLVVAVDRTTSPGGARLETASGELVELPGVREILLNDWAAADLGVEVGDTLALDYFAVGPREELLDRTRNQILLQSAIAAEAQGNASAQQVLDLF